MSDPHVTPSVEPHTGLSAFWNLLGLCFGQQPWRGGNRSRAWDRLPRVDDKDPGLTASVGRGATSVETIYELINDI